MVSSISQHSTTQQAKTQLLTHQNLMKAFQTFKNLRYRTTNSRLKNLLRSWKTSPSSISYPLTLCTTGRMGNLELPSTITSQMVLILICSWKKASSRQESRTLTMQERSPSSSLTHWKMRTRGYLLLHWTALSYFSLWSQARRPKRTLRHKERRQRMCST